MYDNELLMRMLKSEAFTSFLKTYNVGISVFLAIATIAVVVMLGFNIVRLAKSGENPSQRSMAESGIFVCSFCLLILGSIDVFYGILVSLITGGM